MPDQDADPATSLSRDRVIAGAIELADQVGVEPLTIRRLADALGSKPMTLYSHVANKDDILDGMVDAVFGEIDPPPEDLDWGPALRHRCVSARQVLRRHPWAVPLLESRASPGPRTLHHHDAVLGCLLSVGMPMQVVAHAYAIVDAYVYGFAVQEASLPGGGVGDEFDDVVVDVSSQLSMDAYPHLSAFTVAHAMQPTYDFGDSFEVGLDLILDGIERLAAQG